MPYILCIPVKLTARYSMLERLNPYIEYPDIQIATEGALFGCVLSQLPRSLVIVSDDAGQFNILNHALCWIHAERTLAKIIAPSEKKRQILEEVREQIWKFYSELKDYKKSPNQKEKKRLSEKFRPVRLDLFLLVLCVICD